jgi:hypothetical protein
MIEFRIGDHVYRSRKMNAFQQFHCARRLAPVMSEVFTNSELRDALEEAQGNRAPAADGVDQDSLEGLKGFLVVAVPFAKALSHVTDEDCNYVLQMCLQMTQRLQGGNGAAPIWVDVFSERAKRLMFEDMDNLPMLMRIVNEVLQDNLTGFFFGVLPGGGATEGLTGTPTLNS